jgi:hypothetical protein
MDKIVISIIIGIVLVIATIAGTATFYNMNIMETQKIIMTKCLEAKGIWISNYSSYGGHCIIKE